MMAGKNTFSRGQHPTRTAKMMKYIKLTEGDWEKLEIHANKKIKDGLRTVINYRLSIIAHYRKEYLKSKIGLQDIKRSLSAIQSLSDIEAVEAINKLDAYSIAYIDAAIWQKFKVLSENASGKQIIEAAAMALNKLPMSVGGKPIQSHNEDIAKLALRIWQLLGCDGKAWATDEYQSNLTSFANIFFEKVNGFSNSSGTAKMIRGLINSTER